MFPGHIRYDGDVRVCQSAQEHCRNAARYAADSASSADFRKTAYLAALCHDMGKFKDEFRRYLEAAARGEKVARGSVNHTFCGARYILETFHQFEDNRQYASELIAYAIGAHHGLFDCMDEFHRCGFDYRRSRRGIAYEDSLANFLSETRKISFDMVVRTMYETGKDLNSRYRETAEGGLAKTYR